MASSGGKIYTLKTKSWLRPYKTVVDHLPLYIINLLTPLANIHVGPDFVH